MTQPQLPGQISLSDYLDDLDSQQVADSLSTQDPPSLDDAKVSAVLRKLGAIEKTVSANTQMAERERSKITDWEASVNSPLQNEANYLRTVLEGYALHQRLTADRKTIQLPFGVLSTRPAQPEWKVTDTDAFVKWAKQSGIADLVRTTETPAMSVIKNALVPYPDAENSVGTTEGEVVPGITITPPSKPFTAAIKPRN